MPQTYEALDSRLGDKRGPEAVRLAAKELPLVHRMGKAAIRRDWTEIFDEELLNGSPGTDCESGNYSKAVYFFWGCGPYPNANLVALLMEQDCLEGRVCTVTPFDSGAMGKGRLTCAGQPIEETERCNVLDEHTLSSGEPAAEFAGSYIASLFDDVEGYVRSSQKSIPPRLPYHQMEASDLDRRSWTVEVQCYEEIPLRVSQVRRVIVSDRDVWLSLPSAYKRKAAISPVGGGPNSDSLGEAVADTIVADLRVTGMRGTV